jgi:hypothetical protein
VLISDPRIHHRMEGREKAQFPEHLPISELESLKGIE